MWLQATPDEHMNRVLAQGDLPADGGQYGEAMDDLRRILAGRSPFYAKADAVVSTAGRVDRGELRRIAQRRCGPLQSPRDGQLPIDAGGFRSCSIVHYRSGELRMHAMTLTPQPTRAVDYRTDPSRYRHWRLDVDGAVATLAMDVERGRRAASRLQAQAQLATISASTSSCTTRCSGSASSIRRCAPSS